ncbi:MAG: DUF4912 domain-containing protein [Verrucomicrobiota bacterium]|nr:DUF4912 domain-containing protein [Verrucomicrobiota bacterium]
MDFELKPKPTDGRRDQSKDGASFEISKAPVIADETHPAEDEGARVRGTATLCLMARDPHTLFAYWDVDWEKEFRQERPADRKVHLRIFQADGSEKTVEVEPMAGSCYITVENADAVYSGDLGFYQPAESWQSVATSEIISTPPENPADMDEAEFATVPFHLSFQHMIDMLRSTRRNDAPLISQLADLRGRARGEDAVELSGGERELARVVEATEAALPVPNSTDATASPAWRRNRLERILGFGATSPSGGFGGSSERSTR